MEAYFLQVKVCFVNQGRITFHVSESTHTVVGRLRSKAKAGMTAQA